MKPLALALCLALGLGNAAPAQTDIATDIADQYRAAQGVFLPGGPGPVDQRLAMRTLLTELSGRWAPASLMTEGGPDLDAAFLTGFCDRPGVFEVSAPTPYRLVLARARGEITLTETYDYISGTLFQKRVDDAEFLGFMGIDESRPEIAVQMLQSSSRFGPVSLLRPSPDIFVLLPMTGGPASIYARCP